MTVPVPPAELSAHYTIAGPAEAEEAALAVAGPSGIAHEGGPGETLLAGSRAQVLATLGDVVRPRSTPARTGSTYAWRRRRSRAREGGR